MSILSKFSKRTLNENVKIMNYSKFSISYKSLAIPQNLYTSYSRVALCLIWNAEIADLSSRKIKFLPDARIAPMKAK